MMPFGSKSFHECGTGGSPAVAGTPVKRSEDVSKDVSKDGDKKK